MNKEQGMKNNEGKNKTSVTRGYGFLESFLAKQRIKIANKLILSTHRNGRLLDIGCGNYPLFLLNSEFNEKFGIEKDINENYDLPSDFVGRSRLCRPKDETIVKDSNQFQEQKITVINYDIEGEGKMPFESEYFDVVTMLAVFEHIEPEKLVKILSEIHTILKPGGMYIMTTPAIWTDRLLKVMAKLRLVSPVEIQEHKDAYNHSKISFILQKAGFLKEKLRFGYFEMFLNIWATATK